MERAKRPRKVTVEKIAAALQYLSRRQIEAQRLQRELRRDNAAVSLEETMLAMGKRPAPASRPGYSRATARCRPAAK